MFTRLFRRLRNNEDQQVQQACNALRETWPDLRITDAPDRTTLYFACEHCTGQITYYGAFVYGSYRQPNQVAYTGVYTPTTGWRWCRIHESQPKINW